MFPSENLHSWVYQDGGERGAEGLTLLLKNNFKTSEILK